MKHANYFWLFSCILSISCSLVTYLCQYAIISVVRGRAIINPMNPSMAPHTDSESSSIAGLSPIALPIILGMTIVSVIICFEHGEECGGYERERV